MAVFTDRALGIEVAAIAEGEVVARRSGPSPNHAAKVPRHLGKREQPQNCLPTNLPCRAVLKTVSAPQVGHAGWEEMESGMDARSSGWAVTWLDVRLESAIQPFNFSPSINSTPQVEANSQASGVKRPDVTT